MRQNVKNAASPALPIFNKFFDQKMKLRYFHKNNVFMLRQTTKTFKQRSPCIQI